MDGKSLNTPRKNHYVHVVVFLLVVGISAVSFWYYQLQLVSDTTSPPAVSETLYVVPESDDFLPERIVPTVTPKQLRIPSLAITTDFETPLGLNDDRTIEVPDAYDTVGWYQYGPVPGEIGPAVVLGHVDSTTGPAVFFSLGQLEVGEEILIDQADGTTATFTVTRLERHEQADFPTELVYSDIDHAGLRLITCSGTFDRGVQKYSHNLIVFATLTP